MLNAHAEAESPHPVWIVNARHELCEHMPGPGIIRRQKIREALDVVPSTAPPWHLTQIKPVVDAVVHERREPLLIDRVPQAQLGGNSIVEPVQQRKAVASLRRRGQPQKFGRLDVLEKRAIRRRGSVMELVDDDHVEVTGFEGSEASRVEALDRSEDVVELPRALPADPQLSERIIAHAVTKCRQALFEDLFTMGHEQQSRARKSIAKPRVIDRGHDRLARACRGDEQVAMVPTLPRQRDLLEQTLLERFGAKLDRAQEDGGAGRGASRFGGKRYGVIRDEIAAVPIALEHSCDLVDDVWISRT